MRLVDPTDYDILGILENGKRNTAANIAAELERNRGYINTRLPVLKDFGLVDRVGPVERSGLYAITKKGEDVVENPESYRNDEAGSDVTVQRDSSGTGGD
jgi:predicted transcriptional regulator